MAAVLVARSVPQGRRPALSPVPQDRGMLLPAAIPIPGAHQSLHQAEAASLLRAPIWA